MTKNELLAWCYKRRDHINRKCDNSNFWTFKGNHYSHRHVSHCFGRSYALKAMIKEADNMETSIFEFLAEIPN